MKKILLLSASAVLCFCHAACFAGTTAAGAILSRGAGARPLSMAEAYTSISADKGGIAAVHYNPAASAFLKFPEVLLDGQQGMADDNFGSLFLGMPAGKWGAVSGSFHYYFVGDIELIDTLGRIRRVKGQEDCVYTLSYGKTLFGSIGLGATAKYLHSKFIESYQTEAFAGDLGAQAKLFRERLSLGVSVLNVGGKLNYGGPTDESLPLSLRGGASWRWSLVGEEDAHVLTASLDFLKEENEMLQELVGGEYLWHNVIALRMGSKFGQESGKFYLGAGLLVGGVRVDYDLMNGGQFGQMHSASVSFRFGENKKP